MRVLFRQTLMATRYKTLYFWLHEAQIKKAHYRVDSRLSLLCLGWLMGLEPTTTGITILTFYYSLSLINTLQSI